MYLNDIQKRAVEKLEKANRGIIWWRIGTGKTRIALAWSQYSCPNASDKALVVCSPSAIRQWKDEAALCGVSNLEFLSYGELQVPEGVNRISRILTDVNIRCAIIDELWLYKNARTLRSRNVHKIATALPAVGLSGSMVTARSIEDLYGQAYAVNIHKILANNLTQFRSQFCVSAYNFGGLKFFAKVGALEVIQKRLALNVDIHFPPPERESKYHKINVDPTDQQQSYMEEVRSEFFTILDDGTLEIKNAAVLISKIQQISDGAVVNSEGNISRIPSAKFQRTVELCEQLADAGERVLVWCAFKASVDLLSEHFGKKATTLSSHTKFDFTGWSRGQYQFCIATIGSGASLNDFTQVQYAIVYSAPFNHRAMQQALGRTNRKGSEHKIAYYYYMQTVDSVDEDVYSSLAYTDSVEKQIISTSTQVITKYMKEYYERHPEKRPQPTAAGEGGPKILTHVK